MGNIIIYSYCEMLPWLIFFQFIEDGFYHCRCKFFGCKSVVAGCNLKFFTLPFFCNHIYDIHVQRVANCSWFFTTIENTDTFYRRRNALNKFFCVNRTE